MKTLDQEQLRELEALCVAEQPPAVMSLCPLHVDCRSLCAAVKADDFDSAVSIYLKTVPFPGILSTLCEEPCKSGCKRLEVGGAVQMRALEAAAMSFGKVKKKKGFLPRRNERAAVVGSNLFGLTCALELARKGIKVTLYEAGGQLGGSLVKILPEEILKADLEVFEDYPVEVKLNHHIESIRELAGTYDVVASSGTFSSEDLKADPQTYETNYPGVFSMPLEGRNFSVPGWMSDGKRAAISMDRYLKKVSMMAGREKEGSYQTTLHVDISDEIIKEPAGKAPFSRAEAIREAGRCLDCKCLECVKGCAFLEHFKSHPGKYVREVYNNLSIAMGTRHANKMINACSLCGQCAAICPHNLDMGEVMKDARHMMVNTGKMPQSAFEFALNDLEYSQSDNFFLARHQPDRETSRYVFFPGCQLPASAPEVVEKVYDALCKNLEGGVGLILDCCGVIADWAGQEGQFEESIKHLKESWEALNRPIVITACPTCHKVLRENIDGVDLKGIWDVIEEIGLPAALSSGNEEIVIHDACGARNQPEILESIRRLTKQLGYQIVEDDYTGAETACCGFGGLAHISNKEVADKMAASAVSKKDQLCLTYCMNCRDRISKDGTRALHLLELLYDTEGGKIHHIPTYSQRRNNRWKLKKDLLKNKWHEEQPEDNQMKLYFSEAAAQLLEDRMILESDIVSVIENADANNRRIIEKDTGLFIAREQLGNVTFWVYYRQHENGYLVEKAYSHRMTIKED